MSANTFTSIAADTDGPPSVDEVGWVKGAALYRGVVGANGVYYERYLVLRTTPKGAWVAPDPNQMWRHRSGSTDERWTNRDGRFCSPTKERALERLKARTRSYANHCRRRLQETNRRLEVLGLPVTHMGASVAGGSPDLSALAANQ